MYLVVSHSSISVNSAVSPITDHKSSTAATTQLVNKSFMDSLSDVASGNGSESCNNTFSKEQIDQILIALSSTGMASMLTCFTGVLMVIILKLYKKFAYRLAVYQVLAALFFSFTLSLELMALHYDSKSEFSRRACEAVGFLTQYSTWVKLMFTACLTFHLFCLAVFFKNFQKLEIVYILISVFSPLLHAWIPFINDSFGISGAWCWIRGWKNDCAKEKYTQGLIEQFALWYGPFFLVALIDSLAIILMVIVLMVRAFLEKRNRRSRSEPLLARKRDQKREALRQLMPLLIYPLLFLVLILFAMVDRVYGAVAKTASYPLAIIHAVFGLSWGFFAGLALILHLCLLREMSKKKKRTVFFAPPKDLQPSPPLRSVCDTVEPSTATTTQPVVPAESEVDALKIGWEYSQMQNYAHS